MLQLLCFLSFTTFWNESFHISGFFRWLKSKLLKNVNCLEWRYFWNLLLSLPELFRPSYRQYRSPDDSAASSGLSKTVELQPRDDLKGSGDLHCCLPHTEQPQTAVLSSWAVFGFAQCPSLITLYCDCFLKGWVGLILQHFCLLPYHQTLKIIFLILCRPLLPTWYKFTIFAVSIG